MAAVDVGARNHPPVPTDDLDDLFDYDVPADIFQDVNTAMDLPPQKAKAPLGDAGAAGAGLGIDEEVKVIRSRAPIAKLDETRLLSPLGIPKLRHIAKERLKFKGKGHEYSDVARLLNTYQLWLDDLYPRAKFADGLAIIEKLGHTKRMQVMRKEWIMEGKYKEKTSMSDSTPRVSQEPDDVFSKKADLTVGDTDGTNEQSAEENGAGRTELSSSGLPSHPSGKDNLFVSDDEHEGDDPPEDDLDMILTEDNRRSTVDTPGDDLDALLADGEVNNPPFRQNGNEHSPQKAPEINDSMFDDEMEAIADADDW